MNKEHIFPQWLLERTNSKKDMINSPYGKIPADKYTIPLCEECNSQLGHELEDPVSRIFASIEAGNGFTDYDAELLIRWMWKICGEFYWAICDEKWKYGFVTLKERVLSKIGQPRSRISIGIALVDDAYEDFGSAPVGMDCFNLMSNVYAVGVFSHLCIIVFRTVHLDLMDKSKWTIYTLKDYPLLMNANQRTYPKTVYKTGSEAISAMKKHYGIYSDICVAHELESMAQCSAAKDFLMKSAD